jgi:L-fuconate dehydratase
VTRITGFETRDVRFPTSRTLDGSDAMNPRPDYSAACLVLYTSDPALTGHGFVFTIGTGNDVQVSAIRALARYVVGLDVDELMADPGLLSRRLVNESPLRWLGPEKGVMHMAIGAVVNAGWDLLSKTAGLPLWKYLARLSPEDIVRLVDFRYLTDALTPGEALALLELAEAGKEDRIAQLEAEGYPAYSTSPGWLGYSDVKLAGLLREASADGFRQVKLKVGGDLGADVARLTLARQVVGSGMRIAVDANQVWDVPQAITWINELARFDLAWIEEPTSPDDIVGTAAIRHEVSPVPVAVGEHVANRVIFKQLLQARAIDVMQIDACRVAGVTENIANLLLAAKFGVPVCPHAGGVGLCESVQHLSFFDYAAVSGRLEGRSIEWIDHLHEHFVSPASVVDGRYQAPRIAGNSMEMAAASVAEYVYPTGPAWDGKLVGVGS